MAVQDHGLAINFRTYLQNEGFGRYQSALFIDDTAFGGSLKHPTNCLRQDCAEQIYDWQGPHTDLFGSSPSPLFLGATMIPAEADFTQVPADMLATHIMKNSLLGSFDQRPKRLSGVVVYRAPGVLLAQMVDRRVGGIPFSDAPVGCELVAHQVSL